MQHKKKKSSQMCLFFLILPSKHLRTKVNGKDFERVIAFADYILCEKHLLIIVQRH